jgi:hypothetical protein
MAHPNDGTAKSVNPACEADSQSVREQMLSHTVLAKPAFYPACARRTNFLPTQSPYYNIVMGYGGRAPMFTRRPCPFPSALFPFLGVFYKKELVLSFYDT